jgi:potassium-transporting ATPase potassium-binding subunit
MTAGGLLQLAVYLAVLLALVRPVGAWLAGIYAAPPGTGFLGPIERGLYRITGVDPADDMPWQRYAGAVLVVNLLGFLAVYLLQRLQAYLPLNPVGLPAVSPDSAFNTAVSFATNTNWQGYGGESTMGYLTQMAGLGVQNFLSAASGMAVLVAFLRGFSRRESAGIGNFWVDFTRGIVGVLLPLSLLLAIVLVSQGVVQNFAAYVDVTPVEQAVGEPAPVQVLPMGPAASQIAIKQLGTNGGGFFNVNSAHPFENPTPWSNFLELLAILLIPAALCITAGRLVGDPRQGWTLLAAMLVLFVPLLFGTWIAEQAGNPLLADTDQQASAVQSGGNMEGKEVRFGIANSSLWAVATTAASNGSVNSMHGSFTPLGGLGPLWLMQLGEVVFGGVGSGLYGLMVFAILAVFLGGLMVGRTPEYLGKKIEAYEIKMASLVILIPCLATLGGTALAVAVEAGRAGVGNPGPHGFSEILYAFSSAGNNNGSAFGSLSANTPFYNLSLGVAMWVSRYWLMIPVLALAGSLAAKRATAVSAGTLPTHTPLFVALLVGVVVLVGALTFVPALALGPVAEQLELLRLAGVAS